MLYNGDCLFWHDQIISDNTQLQLAMKILVTINTALSTNSHERGTKVFKWFSLCQNVLTAVASSHSIYLLPTIT
jgi:hypothetical protein